MAPSANATWAELGAFVAGTLGPPSEILSLATEAEIRRLAGTTAPGEAVDPQAASHSGMVAKNLLLNYHICAPGITGKLSGGGRARFLTAHATSRAAAATELVRRSKVTPAEIAEFGAHFTVAWFTAALDSRQYKWDEPYMIAIATALAADAGCLGGLWTRGV